jgi:hypothetical protein
LLIEAAWNNVSGVTAARAGLHQTGRPGLMDLTVLEHRPARAGHLELLEIRLDPIAQNGHVPSLDSVVQSLWEGTVRRTRFAARRDYLDGSGALQSIFGLAPM